MKYSIVIPTYNHCDDFLRPCLDSVFQYTNLQDTEIIVVANGCTDGTKNYLDSIQDKVKTIWADKPLGYPKAVNLGIEQAKSEYIILLNNDTVLLAQPKNQWIDLLVDPFVRDPKAGITGPVKFDWNCAGVRYQAMAFWLVMIKRSLFDDIGLLDEIYTPGTGEDGDFCIQAHKKGYKLISVPTDVCGHFETGIKDFSFPIYHRGNGTFGENDVLKNLVIERNNAILYQRYGLPLEVSIIIPTYNHFHDAFKPCIDAVLAYTDLSDKEIIVVANGCTDETQAYLESLKGKVSYIWSDDAIGYTRAVNLGIEAARGRHIVTLDNDSILQPQAVDQWIDILKKPFLSDDKIAATSPFANDYEDIGLLLHSGCTMYRTDVLRMLGNFDEIYNPGYFCDSDVAAKIWQSGFRCAEVPEYNPNKKYTNGVFSIKFPIVHTGQVQTMDKNKDRAIVEKNRKILYERYGKKMIKYSIVIPTYNHCDDLLRPCIESILKYSDADQIEIIVVANGCTDGTKEYVESLGSVAKLIWSDDALGYTRAVNLGIPKCRGEFVILLNNDTELLVQPINHWLDLMAEPFSQPDVGMVGPLILHDNYSNVESMIFFCAMIRKTAFDQLGLLDEIFSPGGGEDIDFSARLNRAGYKTIAATSHNFSPEKGTNVGGVPIWHKDNQTFKNIPEYTNHIVKRNGLINCHRWNGKIKLNIGAGGINYPGYLSVDLYDKRSNIKMDITDLDFDTSTVDEILASHVFEHLNPYHSIRILQNWLRVLKPGGKLVMEMPDIEALCKRFVTASTGERYGILNAIYGSVNTTDEGGPDNITSPHLFGWWPQSMQDHLINAGYTDIRFMPEQIPHPESNFRVEARKPEMRSVDHVSLKQQEPATFIELFELDGYGLNDTPLKGKTVIDIGANLGMFSLRCVELGAARVIAVEAQPTIYNIGLKRIVERYPIIEAVNLAGFSRDDETVRIPNNHVGSSLGDFGEEVKTITLATLLERYGIRSHDLVLKLDCEGSEFDILMTSPPELLRRFSSIHIEIHGNCNPDPLYKDPDTVRNKLAESGFRLVKSSPMYSYQPDGTVMPMDVFVEKFVRKSI